MARRTSSTGHTIPITVRQLEVFLRVAQEGSFTRAAKALELSEPAVSLQVKQLEQVVGARLLRRIPNRPVQVTEAGERVLLTGERLFRELDALTEDLATISSGEQGTVHFAAGAAFCNWLLPPLFASFQAEHPGIAIRVETGRRDLTEGLRQQRFELVVRSAVLAVPGSSPGTGRVEGQLDDVESTHFADIDLVLVGPPGHRHAEQEVALEDLKDERLVLSKDWSAIQMIFGSKAKELGMDLNVRFEFGGIESQISAVTSGLGIAPVPYHVVATRIAERRLVVLQVKGFPMRLPWHLMWKRDQLSVAAAKFRDYLLAQRPFVESQSLLPPARPNL